MAAGDLDGDGVIEMVVGDDRALLRLDPASGVGPTVVNATINSANSEVNTVNLIDLDRDGRAELVLGSGNWGAYDLRVMRPSGDALPVLARAQLGEIWGVGEVRTPEETWVAAAQTHDPTSPLSRQIFGQHTPHGAPQGVYLYAWRGGALLPRARGS